MNINDPIPTNGTVSLSKDTVVEPALLGAADGALVGARVWTYSTHADGTTVLDSSIVATDPAELTRLAHALLYAAGQLRIARSHNRAPALRAV